MTGLTLFDRAAQRATSTTWWVAGVVVALVVWALLYSRLVPFSDWVVSLLPVFLFIVLFLLNREYLRPLWEEPVGKAALGLAAVLIVTGSLIIKKIVDIKA